MEPLPRRERCFSVHDVAAALQQVAVRRGACDPAEVLHALCHLYPACGCELDMLSEVQRALEEGVALGLVVRVGNRYRPANFPVVLPGVGPVGGPGMGGPGKGGGGFIQHPTALPPEG